MALVICNAGLIEALGWLLNATTSPGDLTLHLFSNNYSPVATSTATNFTEATFTGYSAKTITRGSWVTPTIVSGAAKSTYAPQTWTASSSQTLYGYYVLDAGSALVYAEAFGTPRVVNAGDPITLTPTFSFGTDADADGE